MRLYEKSIANEAFGFACIAARLRRAAGRTSGAPVVSTTQTLIDAPVADGGRWSVRRTGQVFVVDHPGRFQFSVPTAEAQSDGWSIVEASEMRARFASRGQPAALTVYADGRAYCDGEFKAIDPTLNDASDIAAEHESPAEVTVSPEFGRLDRSTPGDANNDGYNESCGAYEIAANGRRLELTIAPRTTVLARPVLEIANLPAGAVQVTIEGQLASPALRLPNGHVIIELAARFQRPAVVDIRVN